jgi:hypothetical protein
VQGRWRIQRGKGDAMQSEAMGSGRGTKGPADSARLLLLAAAAATTYLDYFGYTQHGYGAPDALDARLLGNAPAPEQYRMGVFVAAHWLAAHLHANPAMALTLLDGLSASLAVLLLFSALERSATYTRAEPTLQWFGAATLVLLVVWWLGWLLWLQKPETLPATALVAAMLWLWGSRPTVSCAPIVAALLVSTLTLATFRADAACLLNLGFLLYVLFAPDPGLSMPRWLAAVTATLGALAAAAIQFWLARVAFPQTSYGHVKLWQLLPNLIHATRWPPFVLFLLPLVWMVVRGARHGFVRDATGRAVLLGAALYLVLWFTIGKIDEVRIFIPFAFALAPLTVATAMQRAQEDYS